MQPGGREKRAGRRGDQWGKEGTLRASKALKCAALGAALNSPKHGVPWTAQPGALPSKACEAAPTQVDIHLQGGREGGSTCTGGAGSSRHAEGWNTCAGGAGSSRHASCALGRHTLCSCGPTICSSQQNEAARRPRAPTGSRLAPHPVDVDQARLAGVARVRRVDVLLFALGRVVIVAKQAAHRVGLLHLAACEGRGGRKGGGARVGGSVGGWRQAGVGG